MRQTKACGTHIGAAGSEISKGGINARNKRRGKNTRRTHAVTRRETSNTVPSISGKVWLLGSRSCRHSACSQGVSKKHGGPTNGDWLRRKRLGRYLEGIPRLQQRYDWQQPQTTMKIHSDVDWVGCRETRKSTTGGCVTVGKHMLRGWGKTLALIALSSGESEIYWTLKGAAETSGLRAMTRDLGWRLKGEVWSDANAAIGIIHRNGLGKTRHVETGLLWIQQIAAQLRLKLSKVFGRDNPADLYTKHLETRTMHHHLKKLEYCEAIGGAVEAPELHVISKSLAEYHNGNVDGEGAACTWVNTIMEAMTVNKIWRSAKSGR